MIHREKKRSKTVFATRYHSRTTARLFTLLFEKESMFLAVVPRRNLGRESEAKRDEARRCIARLRYASPILPSRGCEWNPVVWEPGCSFRDENSVRDVIVYVISSAALDEGRRPRLYAEKHFIDFTLAVSLSRARSRSHPRSKQPPLYAER